MIGKVEKLDNLGRGIIYNDGKITFVSKTVPEDTIEYFIIKNKKNYNEAKLIRLIEPSPLRTKAPCPFFDFCGGCDIQNQSYENTLNYKKERIINSFKRKNLDINPVVITNPKEYNYRNKISLKVNNGKIGFYQNDSHNIVAIDKCLIASEAINKVIPQLHDFNISNGEVIIRSNKNGEILIIIKTEDKIEINIEKIKKSCKLVGIILNDKTIYGESFLYEVLNNTLFSYSYNSFFQVNPHVAEKLFKLIESFISSDDKVLDIYCGVGTLSLSAAKKAKDVLGIEIVPNAVFNAIHNAKINKFNNINFVLNDAKVAVTKIKADFNKIIVDPPRSGLNKEVIEVIKKIKPKEIIYISCNSDTLLRDLCKLFEYYEINKFYILDMFSYTYHVECVCVLELRNPL